MKNTNENLDGKKLSINTLGFKIYAVDFDGTLFEDKWPEIGAANTRLINHLKGLRAAGDKLILWTCRVNEHLKNAIQACSDQGLEFDAVNDDIQEIKELFGLCGPKIYYDELIDDRNNNTFDLPYCPDNESGMQLWAQREVDIACKRERDAAENTRDWDYGCACYDSALKAFNSLCKDDHSGMSIDFTQNILNRLIDGKSLTPIEDVPEVWSDIEDRNDERKYTCYQNKRMSSLFKYIYDDGTVRYKDVDRYYCIDINNGVTYTTGMASDLIDELYPITMPYSAGGRYKVYCEDFLVDPKMSDYDTKALLYIIEPDGTKVETDRFYKETEDGWERITITEYDNRKASKVDK